MHELREKLLDRLHDISFPSPEEPIRGDFDLNPEWRKQLTPTELTPAAVLVPIINRNGCPSVLFTQRTSHLKTHAGQVSFPGGRLEPGDEGPIDAALRESEEEIGLESDHVDLIGLLDTYQTGTNYIVTPIVGIVSSNFEPRLDTFEVAELFEVPLDQVLDRENFLRESRDVGEFTRVFYAFYYEQWRIWGATAGIMFDLVERMDRA
tara:strand:+ start:159 stop:779 length:621 start_codon:yes stop_codon:yes gene_type:complete